MRWGFVMLLAIAACGDGDGDGAAPDAASDAAQAADAPAAPDSPPDATLLERCEAEVDLGPATGVDVAMGTTAGEDDDVTPECAATTRGAPDVVFRWQAPSAGRWAIDTFGSAYDTILHVRDGGCALLACDDDTPGWSLLSRVDVEVAAGEVVFVAVDGGDGQGGPFHLSISQPPAAEGDCADGLDGDRDGDIDCVDGDCQVEPFCLESVCDDGLDNDGDGGADCLDFDCHFPGSEPCEETLCDDGLDGDGDGFTDCSDPTCQRSEPCLERLCGDGVDGDRDGTIDCADQDCRCDLACAPTDPCPTADLGSRLGTPVAEGGTVGLCNARQPVAGCTGYELEGAGPEATFLWTAPSAGEFVFDTYGSDFQTIIYLLAGSCAGPELACNTPPDVVYGARVVVPLESGETVAIVVDGRFDTSAGHYVLNVVPR